MIDKSQNEAAAALLIQEVDEELRQEQFARLWKKYANLFIAIAVALVLAVAGWQGWQTWRSRRHQAASQAYADIMASIEQGKRDDALARLAKLSADGPAGYRLLAEMKTATLQEAAGDLAGARAGYAAIADDGHVDKIYRDLALLKEAYLDLDSADPAALEKKIAPLAEETSPWRHSAREILALLAVKQGDTAKAIELLTRLSDDPAAPAGVRARAAELLAIQQADKTAKKG